MSHRNIQLEAAECLHKTSKIVQFPLSEESRLVIKDLKDTLVYCDAATGVAAPQIGVNVRILVYHIVGIVPPTIMINPTIVKARDMELEGKYEMCLSYPDRIFKCNRYKNITVRYQDETGDVYVLKYRGEEARILQHEIDHLDGLTIEDRGQELPEEQVAFLLGEIDAEEE